MVLDWMMADGYGKLKEEAQQQEEWLCRTFQHVQEVDFFIAELCQMSYKQLFHVHIHTCMHTIHTCMHVYRTNHTEQTTQGQYRYEHPVESAVSYVSYLLLPTAI